ncbi:MAG: hypothetical protein GXP55_10520 [Deltaproteobacteria bacterium]|nr:hypothetical protein [Deltaproteobacteria bacterium]
MSPQLAVVFGRTGEHRIEPYGQARVASSQPVGPRGVLEDEDPGTVEGATYLLGAGGLLIHFDETFAMGIETGGGFIVPRGDGEMGGAGYAAVSSSLTL